MREGYSFLLRSGEEKRHGMLDMNGKRPMDESRKGRCKTFSFAHAISRSGMRMSLLPVGYMKGEEPAEVYFTLNILNILNILGSILPIFSFSSLFLPLSFFLRLFLRKLKEQNRAVKTQEMHL